MTASRPSPLTPPGCDLRAFDWFPFFHKRLLKSAFWSRASDQACRISVDFWSIAYEQVPAASLPDDDYLLAEWAGFGRRNIETWRSVKSEVMEPWVMCSDGRWYHPTLSEVACKAWVERRVHLWKRECDRIRKENVQRAKNELAPLEMPQKPPDDPFADADVPSVSEGNQTSSEGHKPLSNGKDGASEKNAVSSADNPMENRTSDGKPEVSNGIPAENALKGRGRGTRKEDLSSSLRSEDRSPAAPTDRAPEPAAKPPRLPPKPRKHPYPPDAFAQWYARFPRKKARQDAERAFRKIEAADDTPFETLLAGIDAFGGDNPDVGFWPYPASWLNGRRWLDEPTSSATAPFSDGDRVNFGGGGAWPASTVRAQVEKWRRDPSSWPEHALGPPPDLPGCRVPERLLEAA